MVGAYGEKGDAHYHHWSPNGPTSNHPEAYPVMPSQPEYASFASSTAQQGNLLPYQQRNQHQKQDHCRCSGHSRVILLVILLVPLSFFWFSSPSQSQVWQRGQAWLSSTIPWRSDPYGFNHGISARIGASAMDLWRGIDAKSQSAGNLGLGHLTKKVESLFLSVPSPKSAEAALKRYTAKTHVAGTEGDYQSALDLQQQWADLLGVDSKNPKSRTFDAGSSDSIYYLTGDWKKEATKPRTWTDTYYVWLNKAQGKSSLSLASPPTDSDPSPEPTFVANIEEDVLKEDPTSAHGERVYHGYSKPGKASGPLVYAGYCSLDDFAQLKNKGVVVKGAITVCRYGGPFRGLKVRASADAGAVATLIYSDPLEDGQITEANGYKAYPDGPARHKSAVQRGSVQALSFYPGDPGTPEEPSYKNASRLDAEEADSLPKIPSLPLSYSNAAVLLKALKGHGVNTKDLEHDDFRWVGKVPDVDEYWSGPSKNIVTLNNDVSPLEVKPIWNTYSLIPGHIQDEVVVVGNHRDAWEFGAGDPSSGTAAMHELTAGLGELIKKQWRPLRSILLASWDAEEYGLVGSTEFGEDYGAWLREHAVAYFNVDIAAVGSALKVGASPSLAKLLVDTGKSVRDPDAREKTTIQIADVLPLGSGSDFSVFLQHLGIASSDIGNAPSPRNKDAIYHYHSNYDSFHWMKHFGDPSFERITAIAKLLGLATLRTADSIFLPIDVPDYARAIGEYIDHVEKVTLNATTRAQHLDFCRLRASLQEVQHGAARLDRYKKNVLSELHNLLSADKLQPSCKVKHLLFAVQHINSIVRKFEQHFIDPRGLKDRPWYRSLLVGPGRWLGYGATRLPGITEAVTLDDDLNAAEWEIERLDHALRRAAHDLHDVHRGPPGKGRPGRPGPPPSGPSGPSTPLAERPGH